MNDNKKSYYAIIPADVRYDKKLTPNAKLLYGEITALCNEKGYCWAGNEYFAELYEVSKETISRWISDLIKCGYLTREIVYKEGTKQIINRYLRINQHPIDEKINTPIDENVKDNNTLINNTINSVEQPLEESKTNVYKEIISYLNDKAGRNFSYKNKSTQSQINGRMSEGRTVDDFKAVIDLKVEQWGNDDKMKNYLRPATLFAPTNFENYINEALTTASKEKSNLPPDAPSMKSFDLDEF